MTQPRHRDFPPTRRRLARALYALSAAGTALALTTVALQPASAANDGSDWGAQGTLASDSAATAAWDNSGNSTDNTVPRDSSQLLPHTGGAKTYADVPSATSTAVAADFSGMSLSVSQTKDLTDQAVSLTVSGVTAASGTTPYLQVFQCWGEDGDTEPDPTQCAVGEGGIDGAKKGDTRAITNKDQSLTAGGDLKIVPTITLDATNNIHNQSTLTGTTATLRAEVTAGGSTVATGAAGTIDFDTLAGTPIAKNVPVVNGLATATVTGVKSSDPQSYTATYTATAGENYTSATSSSLTLPLPLDTGNAGAVLPGTTSSLSYASGVFGDSHTIGVQLDGAVFGAATRSDANGGLSYLFTAPTALSTGSHTLTFTDASSNITESVAFTIAPTFTAPAAGSGLGTNSGPNRSSDIPFHAIDGSWVDPAGTGNAYFSRATTNEIDNFDGLTTQSATTERSFEMQTGGQNSGLGCGYRSDEPSTSTCWLVAVPRGWSGDTATGPLTPSLWAQRVQVKLEFSNIPGFCSGSQSRTIVSGGEILQPAISSWTPALCSGGVSLGYAQTTDQEARDQYSSGADSIVFTSQPTDDSGGLTQTLYAPAALTGVTLSFDLYDMSSGYTPIRSLNLNARLVAKLLTESYVNGIDNDANQELTAGTSYKGTPKDPWVSREIPYLSLDPEFQALNPDLKVGVLVGDIVVAGEQSDAAELLWKWIASDPEAKAFLDGCPDTDSMWAPDGQTAYAQVINPFYSTDSYAECSSQKASLKAQADAERAESITPSNYTYTAQSYPPSGGITPQPQYYERDATTNADNPSLDVLALGLPQIHPQETSMTNVALDVFKGLEKRNTIWCPYWSDPKCNSGPNTPGVWQSASSGSYGTELFGATGSPQSADYLETTANLCDDSGNCVGANTKSLRLAAADFGNSSTPGFTESKISTGTLSDDALATDESDGAYPLTLPVYAEINTKGLAAADAKTYAKMINLISTTGQKPGFEPGDLPAGYAPLTGPLVTEAQNAVKTLNEITDPVSSTSTTTSSTTTTPSDTSTSPQDTQAANPSTAQGSTAGTAPSSQASTAPAVVLATSAVTSKTPIGFPQYGVLAGLGVAVLAGAAAPIVSRNRKGGRS